MKFYQFNPIWMAIYQVACDLCPHLWEMIFINVTCYSIIIENDGSENLSFEEEQINESCRDELV